MKIVTLGEGFKYALGRESKAVDIDDPNYVAVSVGYCYTMMATAFLFGTGFGIVVTHF